MNQLASRLRVSVDHQAARLVSDSIDPFLPINVLTHHQLDSVLLQASKVLQVADEASHHQVSEEDEQAQANGRWIKSRSMRKSEEDVRQLLNTGPDRQSAIEDRKNGDQCEHRYRRIWRMGWGFHEQYLARSHRYKRKIGEPPLAGCIKVARACMNTVEAIEVYPPLLYIIRTALLYGITVRLVGVLLISTQPKRLRMRSRREIPTNRWLYCCALQQPHFDPGPSSRLVSFRVYRRPRPRHNRQDGSSNQGSQCQNSGQPVHGLPFLNP